MPEGEQSTPIGPDEDKEIVEGADHFLRRTDNARLNQELNEDVQGLTGLVASAYERMVPEIHEAWLRRKDSREHRELVEHVYQTQAEVSRKTSGGTGKPEHLFPARPYTPAELLLRAAIAVMENPVDIINDPRWKDRSEDPGQQDYFLGKVRTALNILGYDVVTAETGAAIDDALKRGDNEVTIEIPESKQYGKPL